MARDGVEGGGIVVVVVVVCDGVESRVLRFLGAILQGELGFGRSWLDW